ncbi:MAG: hypothetical protein LBT24_04665 [Tannerella sp.]|jgi:hypothetical protein|nr:hypothetical protein [Tannerella sp.]
MKKINEVFFGEKGITSSSANHISNVGKEYIGSTHKSLESLNFVTSTISDFQAEKTYTLKTGIRLSEDEIMGKLTKISEVHAIMAYLREAIKAKDTELKDLKKKEFECSVDFPDEPEKFEMEDAIGELNIKERNEYLTLEAEASSIGKFIHPGSPFDIARKALMDCAVNEAEVQERGKAVMIIRKTPVHTVEEVDESFFKLQKRHREISARLNSIKHKLQERIDTENLIRNREHDEVLSDYRVTRKKEETAFKTLIQQESKRIANLKIAIPHELETVFNFINTL